MREITVNVALRLEGLMAVTGYVLDNIPGLAITPNQQQFEDACGRKSLVGGFRITHIQSGVGFPRYAPDMAVALTVLEKLGGTGVDWTKPYSLLNKSPEITTAWFSVRDLLLNDPEPFAWMDDFGDEED